MTKPTRTCPRPPPAPRHRQLPQWGAVLTLITCTLAAQAAEPQPGPGPSPAWQGHLVVEAQAGKACDQQPTPPYRLPLSIVERPAASGTPHFLAWGSLQTVLLTPPADAQQAMSLHLPGETRSSGEVAWQPAQAQLTGHWREQGTADDPGCSFTQARLELTAVAEPAERERLQRDAQHLEAVLMLSARLATAPTKLDARPVLQRLLALAQARPAGITEPSADLAVHLLRAGETAMGFAERELAASLLAHSSAHYRRLSHRQPEHAALALASEAALHHRRGGLAASRPLIDEGLAILNTHGASQSAAAAALRGRLGAWLLRAGAVQEANQEFEWAWKIEQARTAPVLDQAAALNNLAHTRDRLGQHTEAQQLLNAALQLAGQAGADGEALADVLKRSLEAMQNGAGGGRGRMGTSLAA